MNNRNQYQHYRDEWINNVTSTQMEYFEKEMKHLVDAGIYNG